MKIGTPAKKEVSFLLIIFQELVTEWTKVTDNSVMSWHRSSSLFNWRRSDSQWGEKCVGLDICLILGIGVLNSYNVRLEISTSNVSPS